MQAPVHFYWLVKTSIFMLMITSLKFSAIWTNTFCNLERHFLRFGQIHLSIWTYMYIYFLQFGKIDFTKCGWVGQYLHLHANNNFSGIRCNLDKTFLLLQFGQIHFTIWTNTFYNLDKYFLQFGQINFTMCSCVGQDIHLRANHNFSGIRCNLDK